MSVRCRHYPGIMQNLGRLSVTQAKVDTGDAYEDKRGELEAQKHKGELAQERRWSGCHPVRWHPHNRVCDVVLIYC